MHTLRHFSCLFVFLGIGLCVAKGQAVPKKPAQVHALKITILSTMLADGPGVGEWGFSALVEADGHKILFDTGAREGTVLANARAFRVDLADVPDIVLSHSHWDHVGGLLALQKSVASNSSHPLNHTHVGEGIFLHRFTLSPGIEENPMIAIKPEYEKSGGVFIIHDKPAQIYPGIWLTGPIPRKYPEKNWSGDGRIKTPTGSEEDNIPEDMALVCDTDHGLVVLCGCGHAGIVNTLDFIRTSINPARIHALIGGLHLFPATDETLTWTAEKLQPFQIENLIGAHCTGLETVYRFRQDLHLDRAHCVVGATGTTFDLETAIHPGHLAR